jgi:ribosomal protein L7/L12
VSPEEARAGVLAVATGGTQREEIRAIRVLPERTGLGLLEAKQTVDRWRSGMLCS